MASVSAPLGFKAQIVAWSAAAFAWFIPMLLTSGVAAYTAYFYNQKANTALVVQQQSLSDLQQFRTSGALFDQSVSSLSDALVENKGIDAAKREMRLSIAKNISDAGSIEHLVAAGETQPYISELAALRATVDELDTIDSGQKLWQDSLNLMSHRKKIIASAEQRALRT